MPRDITGTFWYTHDHLKFRTWLEVLPWLTECVYFVIVLFNIALIKKLSYVAYFSSYVYSLTMPNVAAHQITYTYHTLSVITVNYISVTETSTTSIMSKALPIFIFHTRNIQGYTIKRIGVIYKRQFMQFIFQFFGPYLISQCSVMSFLNQIMFRMFRERKKSIINRKWKYNETNQ